MNIFVASRLRVRTDNDFSLAKEQIESIRNKIIEHEEKLREKEIESRITKHSLKAGEQTISELNQLVELARERENAAKESESQLQLQLDLQTDQSRELEICLEQALTRWKMEKERTVEETGRCSRLRSQNAELIDKFNQKVLENERISARLNEYNSLPLPDELKSRINDMENNIIRSSQERAALESDLHISREDCTKLSHEKKCLEIDLDEKIAIISSRNEVIRAQEVSISTLEADIASLQAKLKISNDQIEMKEMAISDLGREKKMLQVENEQLQAMIVSLSRRTLLKADGDVPEASTTEELAPESIPSGVSAENTNSVLDKASNPFTPMSSLSKAYHGLGFQQLLSGIVKGADEVADTYGTLQRDHISASLVASRDGVPMTEVVQVISNEMKRSIDNSAKLSVQHTVNLKGGIGLIALMQENLDNEYILWRAARALRDIVQNKEMKPVDNSSNSFKIECVANRADVVALDAMDAKPGVASVQAQCMRLIGCLAYENDFVRRRVGERGGLGKIVRAMDAHTDDETVQLHASTMLTNLMHNSSDNRSRFIEASGVEVLVSVMERLSKSAKVQRQCCWTLLTLAGSDDVSRAAVSFGAASAIVSAMISHRYDAGVQQFGCWSIANLALAGDDVRRRLKLVGVLEVCRIALETHPTDQEVVRQARNAVGVLGPQGGPKL